MGSQSTIFLGECFLDKEDVVFFAQHFAKAVSNFEWPDCLFAVVQCPFCCNVALPVKDKKSCKNDEDEGQYIMIVQNIMQNVKMGNSLQRIHRGLPRLCCKSCFEKNMIQEPDDGEEHTYPGILKHGIHYHAAKGILSKGLSKIEKDEAVRGELSFVMWAYSLFGLYERSGMCSAIDEFIYVRARASLDSKREEFEKMGTRLGSLSIKDVQSMQEKSLS